MTDLQTIRFSGNGRLFQDISKNVALIGSRDASQAALIAWSVKPLPSDMGI